MIGQQPELEGKLLIKGTWDFDFIEELCPQLGDVMLQKTCYSKGIL